MHTLYNTSLPFADAESRGQIFPFNWNLEELLDFGVSQEALNRLAFVGITTIGDLVNRLQDLPMRVPGIGTKRLAEISRGLDNVSKHAAQSLRKGISRLEFQDAGYCASRKNIILRDNFSAFSLKQPTVVMAVE